MTHDLNGTSGDAGANAQEVWEERYAEKPRVWSGRVNARLAEVAAELRGGRALDLGCGEGADAIWLAERGWTVVAVDISPTALGRAQCDADARGVGKRVRFVHLDLGPGLGGLPSGPFDLVSAQFLHSTVAMDRAAILRAAAEVLAPGGSLLIVDHAEAPPWASALHHHEFPSAEMVLAGLALDPKRWQPVRVERVSRQARGPDGSEATLWDSVIVVRRLGGGSS